MAHVDDEEADGDAWHTWKLADTTGAAPPTLPVTVAESPQLSLTMGLLGGTSVVAMVGVVFVPLQSLGSSSAASVVVSVPAPAVESDHVTLQPTLMVELGVRAARSAALSVCVNVWDVAPGGVAFAVGDATMDKVVVLSVAWDIEKVPVSDWFQSLYGSR